MQAQRDKEKSAKERKQGKAEELDAAVMAAGGAGVSIEAVAEVMGATGRTVRNRVEGGKFGKPSKKWRIEGGKIVPAGKKVEIDL